MFKAIKKFFFGPEPVEVTQPEAAPYKVEVETTVSLPTAELAKCGCGRSPSGFCSGLHGLTDAEWAKHADNPNKPVKAKKVAVKKPAAKKPATKPAAKKAPATKKKPAPKKTTAKK